jgi:hypothetical protein
MITKTSITCILVLASTLVFPQSIKTFEGTFTFSFTSSTTHKLNKSDRDQMEKEISNFLPKMNLMTSYFRALASGNSALVKDILKKNPSIGKENEFGLATMFNLTRMKQLGVFYKPCFQVDDLKNEPAIIVCTEKEYEILNKDEDLKNYIMECEYVGDLVLDNFQVYRLISFK